MYHGIYRILKALKNTCSTHSKNCCSKYTTICHFQTLYRSSKNICKNLSP